MHARSRPTYRCPATIDRRRGRSRGFTIIELLTVMFIIALLVAILIPSLNSARNAAKKSSTSAVFQALRVGLDLFKNENEKEFALTNGYPPSFAHPPIPKSDGSFAFSRQEAEEGRFPFQSLDLFPKNPTFKTRVNGAHFLPAMLMGMDRKGYIKRSSVSRQNKINEMPEKWYDKDPLGPNTTIERRPLYVDPGGVRTVPTLSLLGKPNVALFPDWDKMNVLPVIVDAFDQPILYYAANANGKPSNMVADERDLANTYAGGVQENGPPYYVHDDNHAFTGDETAPGWDFGGGGAHWIAKAGDALDADAVTAPEEFDVHPENMTFARFIIDRTLLKTLEEKRIAGGSVDAATPLQPVNAQSYLLISAGVDGRFGTRDDVTNFPLSAD